jgi:uncharacterized protein (DUF2164 family)
MKESVSMKEKQKEEKAAMIQKLKEFFEEEREESLGDLPAALLADFIENEMGPLFFNRGVQAAKAKALGILANLDEELDFVEMILPKRLSRKP